MFTLTGKHQSAPDQQHFSPSDTLPSQPKLGSSRKKKIQGLIKNNVEFPGVIKKNHVKSPGILVFSLKISEECKQFCGVSRGQALFCLEFSGVK